MTVKWSAAIGLVALLALAAPMTAGFAAVEAKRPRPSDLPWWQVVTEVAPNELTIYNDYATPERVFSSEHVVVHYVAVGIDAPSLNDDNADGVPDYVERVGEAADTAITYYQQRGFVPIRPDSAGPDSRPDLYISRFAPGYMGLSLPTCDAAGGAFIAVANNLDPSAGRSFASLYATVAHELFHLVQFSYFPAGSEPALADWVLEGSASALESRLYPDLADLVSTIQLRSWFAAPNRPIVSQSYNAQLLWRYLDARSPRLLDTFLRRLGAQTVTAQAAALVSTYEQLTGDAFASAFGGFALAVAADHPTEITPIATLAVGAPRDSSVAPLAIHYLRLRIPKSGDYLIRLTFHAKDAAARTALTYQLQSEIAGRPSLPGRLQPRATSGGRIFTFMIPTQLRRNDRFTQPQLVIANGATDHPLAYTVSALHHDT